MGEELCWGRPRMYGYVGVIAVVQVLAAQMKCKCFLADDVNPQVLSMKLLLDKLWWCRKQPLFILDDRLDRASQVSAHQRFDDVLARSGMIGNRGHVGQHDGMWYWKSKLFGEIQVVGLVVDGGRGLAIDDRDMRPAEGVSQHRIVDGCIAQRGWLEDIVAQEDGRGGERQVDQSPRVGIRLPADDQQQLSGGC
jgi:hypothetical protein